MYIIYYGAQFEAVRDSIFWPVLREAYWCALEHPSGAQAKADEDTPPVGAPGAARIVNSRHFVPFESFIAAGAFYLCLTFVIAWLFKLWERRWHAHLRARDSTGAPSEPQATFSAR